MYTILVESPEKLRVPKIISKKRNLRLECVLQTVGDINRNRRMYKKEYLEEGIKKVYKRIEEGSLLGELDHPIDKNPTRQLTVLFKEASHRILDLDWRGNKLVGIVECLNTPNGNIMKNLIEDGVPIGFSFRGMGDLREMNENGQTYHLVVPPVNVITWDAVSYPSHESAKVVRVLESVGFGHRAKKRDSVVIPLTEEKLLKLIENVLFLKEADDIEIKNGLICTTGGHCYLPSEFCKIIEKL